MSFPRYPAYKPSGVEWLGEVPGHWEVRKISQLFIGIGSGTTPKSDEIEYYEDGDIPWVVTGDLNDRLLESCSNFITKKAMQAHTTLRQYPKGSVAMAMYGATIGKASLLGLEATVNQACCVLPPSVKANENFLLHFLISARNHLISLATGGGQPNINQDIVRSLRIPLPPVEEQSYITTFLNHETAKIDALIAEQQRLIELLQEKRKAVISHAVTKGLNPDAPMKDSGVEWLGEVPEHWEVKRVKHLCTSIEQGWSPQCENEPSDGDTPGILKVGCVNGGSFRPSENKKLPPDLIPIPEYSVRSGDLLVSRANTRELVGSAAVVNEDFPWLFICDKLYRITISPDKISANYLALFLASNEARGQIELGASGASQSMQNISQSILMDLPIPLPHPEGQESIRNSITIQCGQIGELTAKASDAIALLQERRSALISAAVTGQIDVRGLAPEAVAA